MYKMIRIIFILALATASVLASPIFEGRIVNGTNAKVGEVPYIVSLRQNRRHRCGGTILDETHILTAAHCVYQLQPTTLSIQYGQLEITEDDTSSIPVESLVWHAQYKPGNGWPNDIAVMKLKSKLPLGTNVKVTPLPPANDPTPEGAVAVVSGWGIPYTGGAVMKQLQRVDIFITTDKECESANASAGPALRQYHICAGIPEGGKGECNGDSGGPLIANGKQVGIVSWSVKPCTQKGYPGVYTRVASYIDWIKQNTQ